MVEQRMTSNEAVDIVERVLKALKKAGADDGRVRLDGGSVATSVLPAMALPPMPISEA